MSGIDADDGVFDGMTLLRTVLGSLQIIRSKDVGMQAQRFSRKISNVVFIMRPGGMQAYLGEVEQLKLSLDIINRPLSDAEVLGRVKSASWRYVVDTFSFSDVLHPSQNDSESESAQVETV